MKPVDFALPFLEWENVHFSTGTTELLDGFTARAETGICTVVMGPSGSGKSTVARIGAGLVPPDSGAIRCWGVDWNSLTDGETSEFRLMLGFVFQQAALWSNKSVYQNLEFPYLYHHPKADIQEVRDAIAGAARLTGIQHQLALRPSQLSLGEQKLVALARALVLDPPGLILDDPTGGLEAQGTERLIELFGEMKRRKKSLLLVTQEPSVTARVADNLLLLKAGRVVASGPFREVTRSGDPETIAILTTVLSQAATFSDDILGLLSIDGDGSHPLE